MLALAVGIALLLGVLSALLGGSAERRRGSAEPAGGLRAPLRAVLGDQSPYMRD
jgi:hypothetical protein